MAVLFQKQKNGTKAVFGSQLYGLPQVYLLEVGAPTYLPHYSISMALRMSVAFTDAAPAPRSRTIVLGKQNRSIRA